MGSLLVITGPPGSGKSTLAAVIAARSARSVLVEGDAFFGFLAEGKIPPWLPESNEQNLVVTEACGEALDWVVLMPTEEICRQRVERRARASFSDLEATSKMHHEFSTSKIDDRHIVDSGSMTPAELADVVETRRTNEGLRVRR